MKFLTKRERIPTTEIAPFLDFHFAERFPVEIVTDVPPKILRERDPSLYGLR